MNTNDQTGTRGSTKHPCALAALLLVSMFTVAAYAENPPPIAWIRQFGTSSFDHSYDVTTDATGNVLITGHSMGGTSLGDYDAFVIKYDTTGNLVWMSQLGTTYDDQCYGVATDTASNVFIAGTTYGDLGGPNAGESDAFLGKFDSAGNLVWTRQIGTLSADQCHGVAVDAMGNVFIVGNTGGSLDGPNAGNTDVFVSKYDTAGNFVWIRQVGTAFHDSGNGVAVDAAGNVIINGSTEGKIGGLYIGGEVDAFVSKYDTVGNPAWVRQDGTTEYEISSDVATDAMGNVFITGLTYGDIGGTNAGSSDAYVSKYDNAGNLVWSRQIGTSGHDRSDSVTIDAAGNVFIAGYTYGDLDQPNAGISDVFVCKYDAASNLAWTRQLGTSSIDYCRAVATDAMGNLFITGSTGGNLGGPNLGESDIFLIKFASITSLGDANNDQQINLADLQILGDNWQANGANWATGDFTGDGLVNLADLQILGDNWGYGVDADISFEDALLAIGLNVPEPTALALLVLCCLAGELARTTRSKLHG